MNVPFQLKVPIDVATRLGDHLAKLQAAHQKELEAFDKRLKTHPDPEKLFEERRTLQERGRKITIQNLVRAALITGVDSIDSLTVHNILAVIAKDEIVRGRPRERR